MAAINPIQANSFDNYQSRQRQSRIELERRITAATLGDAVLFPDLCQLQSHPKSPNWIKDLDFPELLLNQEKPWKEYDFEQLSPKHPLFQTLHRSITQIQQTLNLPELQPIQPALERVQMCYERYIQNCCLTEGKQRRSFLKGPARLIGFLHGEVACKELDRKRARKLVSINRYNDDVRTNEYGASAVAHHERVFYKRSYRNPLQPGNERLFDLFNNLFLGGRATPIKLLKLSNIYVKELDAEKHRSHPVRQKLSSEWLQIQNNGSPSYSQFVADHPDFVNHPFEEQKRDFLVQASLGVEGEEFHRFLLDNPGANFQEMVKLYNFQAMALLSLILRVDDGRGDNYMIEEAGEGGREIVGIDNDGILAPPIHFNKAVDNHHTLLRSILFLLPQLMDQALDEQLAAHLLSLDIEKTFISFLRELEQFNQSRSFKALSERDLGELSLPIALSLSDLLGIYHSVKKVQEAVRENPQATVDHLFSHLFPIVHRAYKKLAEDKEKHPIEIQNILFDKKNPPNIETLLEMNSKKVKELSHNLIGMFSNEPSLSIPNLLPAFIDSIFPDLNAKKQEELLKHTHSLFEDFKKTSFKGSKLSDSQFARIVERKKIKELFLEETQEVTPLGLMTLINDYPNLKIVLGRNRQFDVNAYGELIKNAQKMGRPLYCQIHGKEYSLSQQDLRKIVQPAIEYGHLALAETLISHFPLNLSVTDKQGNTILHQMAKRGTPDSVRFLIEKCGFPLMLTNHLGQTAFHLAAEEGNVKTLETLIHFEGKKGKGLSLKDKNKRTPFHCAAFRDRNEAVARLLHEILTHRLPAGEEVHLEPDADGNTLLHMAAKFDMADAIPFLLDRHQIDVNVRGRFGRTPLHMATHNGQVEAARKLIERGADVNARCDETDSRTTPLHEAAFRGHTAVVELLLQSENLDINLKNSQQFTPADIAVMVGSRPVATLLITHPDFQGGEKKLDDYIEEAKKFRQSQLLPLLYTERSIQLLNRMAIEDRNLERERIITRLQGLH